MRTLCRTCLDRPLFLLTILCPFAAGCGVETYQARVVENTVPLFRYELEMNSSLGPEWSKGEVHLRLPVGLKEIPGPKKKEDEETRLPPSLSAELEGILGGFRGKVDAITAGGQPAKADMHVLVMSNRSLIASPSADAKPNKFDSRLVNTIAASVGTGTSSGNLPSKRFEVGNSSRDRDAFGSIPPKVVYEMVQLDTMIDDVPMQYEIYFRREAPLIVAVVFLVPKEPDRSERLREKIDLSLQTLRIPSRVPARRPAVAGWRRVEARGSCLLRGVNCQDHQEHQGRTEPRALSDAVDCDRSIWIGQTCLASAEWAEAIEQLLCAPRDFRGSFLPNANI